MLDCGNASYSTYTNKGCRCDKCRESQSEYRELKLLGRGREWLDIFIRELKKGKSLEELGVHR
jgi:hypothetical protein